MLPVRESPKPGLGKPSTLPLSLPSGNGDGGTSFLGRGFFSDDFLGERAIGLEHTELLDTMELVVP